MQAGVGRVATPGNPSLSGLLGFPSGDLWPGPAPWLHLLIPVLRPQAKLSFKATKVNCGDLRTTGSDGGSQDFRMKLPGACPPRGDSAVLRRIPQNLGTGLQGPQNSKPLFPDHSKHGFQCATLSFWLIPHGPAFPPFSRSSQPHIPSPPLLILGVIRGIHPLSLRGSQLHQDHQPHSQPLKTLSHCPLDLIALSRWDSMFIL